MWEMFSLFLNQSLGFCWVLPAVCVCFTFVPVVNVLCECASMNAEITHAFFSAQGKNGHRDKFHCYRRFHDQGRSSDNFENLTIFSKLSDDRPWS